MGTQSANTPPTVQTAQPEPSHLEPAPAAPAQPGTAQPGPARPGSVKSTRASRAWIKLLPAFVLLAAILVFVFGNLRSTKVSFATASGTMPLAVALLAAAALGGLLVFALGSIRIIQLRRAVRRPPEVTRT